MRALLGLSLVVLWLSGAGWPVPQRTEGLRIAIAHEMAEQGHWIVPTLWGEPILTKPPAFYWSLIVAEKVLPGWGLAAYRLVSVFSLFGIALLTMRFLQKTPEGKCLGGKDRLLVAVLILPLSLAALGQLPSAEMDLAFSFWVIAFWLSALELGMSPAIAKSTLLFLLAWLGLGCLGGVAILFKWTAPAFFVPAGGWFWIYGRSSVLGKVAATLLCALPMIFLPAAWLVAVGSSVGWPLLIDTLKSEAMPHLSPAHHTRSYPFSEWITYPIQVFGMALPAALPLFLTCARWLRHPSRQSNRASSAVFGLAFMLAGSLLLWTLIPGHRPRHALPIAFGLVVAALPSWCAWLLPLFFVAGEPADGRSKWARRAVLGGLITFGAMKGGLSLGSARGRQEAARVLADAAKVRNHLDGATALYLGKFKDDGLVFLVGVRAIRWDPAQAPPGPVLCSERDLAAFRAWKFAKEIPLLDQQGDPLYLLLKPSRQESKRANP